MEIKEISYRQNQEAHKGFFFCKYRKGGTFEIGSV